MTLKQSLISEPKVTTEPDGALVFSVTVPGLDEGSIVVEYDGAGRYRAKADLSEALERKSAESHFAFEFVLQPASFGEPAWAYTDDVLRVTVPPR